MKRTRTSVGKQYIPRVRGRGDLIWACKNPWAPRCEIDRVDGRFASFQDCKKSCHPRLPSDLTGLISSHLGWEESVALARLAAEDDPNGPTRRFAESLTRHEHGRKRNRGLAAFQKWSRAGQPQTREAALELRAAGAFGRVFLPYLQTTSLDQLKAFWEIVPPDKISVSQVREAFRMCDTEDCRRQVDEWMFQWLSRAGVPTILRAIGDVLVSEEKIEEKIDLAAKLFPLLGDESLSPIAREVLGLPFNDFVRLIDTVTISPQQLKELWNAGIEDLLVFGEKVGFRPHLRELEKRGAAGRAEDVWSLVSTFGKPGSPGARDALFAHASDSLKLLSRRGSGAGTLTVFVGGASESQASDLLRRLLAGISEATTRQWLGTTLAGATGSKSGLMRDIHQSVLQLESASRGKRIGEHTIHTVVGNLTQSVIPSLCGLPQDVRDRLGKTSQEGAFAWVHELPGELMEDLGQWKQRDWLQLTRYVAPPRSNLVPYFNFKGSNACLLVGFQSSLTSMTPEEEEGAEMMDDVDPYETETDDDDD